MKFLLTKGLSLFLMMMAFVANAQEIEETPLDTLTRSVSSIQSDLENSKKLKFSGYIQAQYQYADTIGAASFAGGNFIANTQHRMTIRRGRIKAAYSTDFAKYVLQFDVTEKGLALKDAYGSYNVPYFLPLTFTAGVFDRPFGYEISYSSSLRESPERSMIFQTLFPGERDLGAKVTFQMPKTSRWSMFKLDLGVFNGSGGTAIDFDDQKDIIAHLAFNKSNKSEKLSIGAGLSYYNGGNLMGNKYIYSDIKEQTSGVYGFTKDSSALSPYRSIAKREFYGIDIQLTYDMPLVGLSSLRAEFITGTQAGTSSSSRTPSALAASDTYIRPMQGGYVIFLQNIGNTKHQIVAKYDWYDPNTKVKGNQIGVTNSKTTAADIAYSTIGLGWVYRFDPNVKLTFYYDMVTNEISDKLSGYTYEKPDNVFTARVQYKF